MAFRRKKHPVIIRDHERHERFRRRVTILVVLLATAGCLGFFWFLTLFGPQAVDPADLELDFAEIPEEVRLLREQSVETEARFEEVLALREPNPEDLELLRNAVVYQQRFIDALPGYDAAAAERLDGLTERYHQFAAQPLFERSLELERQAEAIESEDDFEKARQTYLEAFRLQNLINEDFPESRVANLGRATRLQRKSRHLSAEPLLRRSRELEAQALERSEAAEWETAETLLRQAIAIQDQINREYRDSGQASVLRRETLQTRLVGIQSGQEVREIESLMDLAAQRQAEGEYLEAASLYQQARRMQETLNSEYPGSPHASAERVAALQRSSQTAQSYELGMDIERLNGQLGHLLAGRRTSEAVAIIVELREKVQQLAESYPRSSLNDENLSVKISYLNLIQGDIAFIQERVYAGLLPVPEGEGRRMLRTEVPQALYELIMGANPSRNRGDLKPVETINWNDAKSFCERLSWILGKPVRLPTENEFRLAIGPLRYVKLEEHAWGADASGGESQDVGGKEPLESGFLDLLGNVSEWVESVDALEDEPAKHLGGHFQDSLEVLFTVPVRTMARGARSRFTGFRIVVGPDA